MEKQLYDRNDSIYITRNRNGITVENLSNILNSAMCTQTENKGMIFTDDKGKEYRFEQKVLMYGAAILMIRRWPMRHIGKARKS